jgi:hypothetical protein
LTIRALSQPQHHPTPLPRTFPRPRLRSEQLDIQFVRSSASVTQLGGCCHAMPAAPTKPHTIAIPPGSVSLPLSNPDVQHSGWPIPYRDTFCHLLHTSMAAGAKIVIFKSSRANVYYGASLRNTANRLVLPSQMIWYFSPVASSILAIARLYASRLCNLSTYANIFGFVSFVKPSRMVAASTGKLIKISAAVRSLPHRYSPPSGDDASCSSRKPKWVLKVGSRYTVSSFPTIMLVIGLMKKGTGAFLSPSRPISTCLRWMKVICRSYRS